jgi:hypothetical protein
VHESLLVEFGFIVDVYYCVTIERDTEADDSTDTAVEKKKRGGGGGRTRTPSSRT